MNTTHSYPHDPYAPTCFYGHINMLTCILQSHKFTTKQSPIHSQDSVKTFSPLSSFSSSINTYTRTTKPAHRCKAAECVCVSRSINEQRYQQGREGWSEGGTASEWDDNVRRRELWMQHFRTLLGGEICHRGVKAERSSQSPLEQRRQ